ncbi:ABC transporter ATP-binding protein [candidate division WWE3 bacterium]|nr:ABC transporter ATP-binding protein [candidate division WWE3 bacterium]
MAEQKDKQKSQAKTSTADIKYDYQKLSWKEFFRISKWAIGSLFRVSPVAGVVHIITTTILQYQDLLYSYIMAKLIDALIKIAAAPDKNLDNLYKLIYIVVIAKIIEMLLRIIENTCMVILRVKHRPIIRRSFYLKLKELGLQTLEKPDIHDSIARADNYLTNLLQFYRQNVGFVTEILKLFSLIVIVTKFLPQFTIFLVITYIPYVIFDKYMRKENYKFDWENTEKNRITGSVANSLSNVNALKEIYITNAFGFLDKKYMDFQNWFVEMKLKITAKWRIGSEIFNFLNDLTLIFVGYLKLFTRVVNGLISVGDATFWIQTLSQLSNSLRRVLSNSNDIFENALWFKEAEKLYSMPPAFADGDIVLPVLKSGPSIKIKNLDFTYPNAQNITIKNLTLEIKAGEKIAIVGHNGAGKTTLVRLLSRFYQPSTGIISINDINLKDIQIDSFYKNLGVLFQDYNTYGYLTVEENIHMGKSDQELDEVGIRLAAFSADALNFIEELPNKFDQILTESIKSGIRPSSGQWQKIAMARFFYRDAPLVIFDEPTAAIDPVSEYNIFNKIYEFFKGKTVIIISHRFSTVRNADRIIVMDRGEIVEQGSHKKLMEMGGRYAKMFNLQAEGYK